MADQDRSWTEAESGEAVAELRATLSNLGVGPATRIAHRFGLEPLGVVAMGAVARAGAVLAPVHTTHTDTELARWAEAARPTLALTSSKTGWIDRGWSQRAVRVSGFGDLSVWEPGEIRRDGDVAADPRGGVLLTTSGSDGEPKHAHLAWSALVAGAVAANERLAFGPDDRWLATLAWAHVGGLAVAIRVAAAGAALVFGPARFVAEDVLEALASHGATHISLVPAMLHRLLEVGARPPGSLRCALLGGAATPPDLVERALSGGWPVALTYGLTEAGSQVATATPTEVAADPRSCGRPLTGTQVRLAAGEIQVRGPSLFRGYLGSARYDAAEWFATGDLGRLDESGRLYVTGRRRDRIVTGGANVDPVEVEAALTSHPDVTDAVVIGLPHAVYGEIVTAILVGEGDDLETRVDAWAREHLSGPRAPRRWRVLPELPRTATGKVDRARVRHLLSPESWTSE